MLVWTEVYNPYIRAHTIYNIMLIGTHTERPLYIATMFAYGFDRVYT